MWNIIRKFVSFLAIFSLFLSPFFVQAESLQIYDVYVIVDQNDVVFEWRTSVPTRGRVDFGRSRDYGRFVDDGIGRRLEHKILVTNLDAERVYHYQITAVSESGETVRTFSQTFKTGKAKRIDFTPPEISEINLIYYTDREAFITFRTDEESEVWVRYGIGSDLSKTVRRRMRDTYHEIKLDRLAPGTLYSYYISARDEAGNLKETAVFQFRTLNTPGTRNDPLEIRNIRPLTPVDSDLGHNNAVVSWRTNRPATGKVEWKHGLRGRWQKKESRAKEYDHRFELDGLSPGTEYIFKVSSKDVFSKRRESGERVFVTRGGVRVKGMSFTSGISPADVTPVTALYRTPDSPRVYAIMNGQKHWLRSLSVFNSYGLSWSDVETVPQVFLDQYPEVRLIQISGSGNMYYIYQRLGRKKLLASDEVFSSYPANHLEKVVVVTPTDALSIPDLELAKVSGDPIVYLIEGTVKRAFANERAFLSRGYEWSSIGIISKTDLDSYIVGASIF